MKEDAARGFMKYLLVGVWYLPIVWRCCHFQCWNENDGISKLCGEFWVTIYSALVVLNAISVCILEHQRTGQEAKVMT
jgi:hypothetical protein